MIIKRVGLFLLVCSCAGLLGAVSNEDTPVWTDPANAISEDPDFSIQGEYGSGKACSLQYGVQVVAMGNHTFDAYVLEGGLPGAGWDKTKKRTKLQGRTENGVTILTGPELKAIIEESKLTLENKGSKIAQFPRIQRESPTLGQKPPTHAVVLFDGTNTDAWKDGRITDDRYLMQGCTSKKLFGSYMIHLEFRTPYKPFARGQNRGNSGHYLQGRYETQVLDSFGCEGKRYETGGIYNTRDPDLNMCLPPLSWQTYDVDFTSAQWKDGKKITLARMTVRLNGVIVQDNVECDHATASSKIPESPELGPIYLQDHNNPVFYRNIWVVEKR